MSGAERFRRVDALFRAASALPRDAREAYLARECGDESSIFAQVRSLLSADEQDESFLDRPALVSVDDATSAGADAVDGTPEWIGGYRIIRKIGEGGMGAVYEAEQQRPRRRVALKLLRQIAGGRALLQRFQREATILGRLQHPGIAQILEAGSIGDGREACAYFAMELVHGRTLLEHAREFRLDTRGRLELFVSICDAVQYAHQCGVVHRDVKPANILVVATSAGAESGIVDLAGGRPKILDFGVARLVDPDLAQMTQHTSAGELVGTVPYMSPEQAAGDPAELDWRSDVYSLGVVLYELLTGRLPHEVRRLMVHAAVRVIREDDPTPAGSIDRALRGDIETILAKALEKSKLRRYQSAAELAADIRRHLREQPISARPASALYRVGKFTRRNKAIVVGTAAAFISLAVGTVVAVRQAILAERARIEEHRLRGEAEQQSYRASLVAASSALRYHETADARRQLDAAPRALRGWEWAHLDSRVDDSVAVLNLPSIPVVLGVNSDGRNIVACRSSGEVRSWSLPDLAPLATLDVNAVLRERRIEQVVFSPGGCELRIDTRAGSIWVDPMSLELRARDDHPAIVRSRDGKWGIFDSPTAGKDEIVLREIAGEREILRRAGANVFRSQIRFSDDGALLAVVFENGDGLRLFRVPDGAERIARHDLTRVSTLAFSHDGARLAAATESGAVSVLDTSNGETVLELAGQGSLITALGFSPADDRIAAVSNDRTVRFWRTADGEPLALMHGHHARVSELAFSADGKRLITACDDQSIRWWNAAAACNPFVIRTPGSVYGLAFSPDGEQLTAACLGGERPLRSWNVESGREVLSALDGYASTLAYSGDGTRIAVGRSQGTSLVLDAADGRILSSMKGHTWCTNWIHLDRTGQLLITLGNDGKLIATSLADNHQPPRVKTFPAHSTGEGCRAAVSPDGSLIAVVSGARIELLDAESWNTVGELKGHGGSVYALAFSPDGARLVSGGSDRMLRVWDVAKRAPLAVLAGHSDTIFAAEFSPDGKRIVSGGRDSVIRVWDAQRLDEITQLHGHESFVYCLVFSRDGRVLASGGGDSCVRLWDTRPYRDRLP